MYQADSSLLPCLHKCFNVRHNALKTLIIISALLFYLSTNAQKSTATVTKTKTLADTTYIPIDLDDCFKQLDNMFSDSIKATIKVLTESEFSGRNHLGFGMWIRNNWRLWQGSRLSKYFNSLGIYHPDDMTGVIFDSYHRRLTGNEIKLNEQVKIYDDYWEKVKRDDVERRTKEYDLYKLGDSVSFKYHYGFTTKNQEKKFDQDICSAKGIITGKDKANFFIKVRLIESCDKKGIVSQGNNGAVIYDPKSGKTSKPKKRVIVYMKTGQENWFNYNDWGTPD